MFNRMRLIENQADFVVFSIRGSMGSWIRARVARCNAQVKKSSEDLQKLCIPSETLRAEWRAQKANLASVENRKQDTLTYLICMVVDST